MLSPRRREHERARPRSLWLLLLGLAVLSLYLLFSVSVPLESSDDFATSNANTVPEPVSEPVRSQDRVSRPSSTRRVDRTNKPVSTPLRPRHATDSKATVRYVSSAQEFLQQCAPAAYESEFARVLDDVSTAQSVCIDEKWTGKSRTLEKLKVEIPSDDISRRLRPSEDSVPFGQRGIVLSTLMLDTLKVKVPREVPVFLRGIVRWADSLQRVGVPGLLFADKSAINALLESKDILQAGETLVFAGARNVEVTVFDRDAAAQLLPLVSDETDIFPTLRKLVPGPSDMWDKCADDARRKNNLNAVRAADLLHVNDLRFAVVAQATAKSGVLEKRGFAYSLLMDGVDARLGSNPFVAMRAASDSLPQTPLFVGYERKIDITGWWITNRFKDCYPTRKRPSWLSSKGKGPAMYNAGVLGGTLEAMHALASALTEFFPCVLSVFNEKDTRHNQQRLEAERACNMMGFNVLLGAIRKAPTLAFEVTDGALGGESSDCAIYAGSPFVSRFKFSDRCGAIVYHK